MPRSSVFTVILAVFISTGQLSQPALSQDAKMLQKDIVVAKVEGQKIYRRELLRAFQGLPKEVKQTGLEVIYPKLVERLIQQRLLIIEGRAKNLSNDSEVLRRMKQLEGAVIGEIFLNRLIEKNLRPELLKERYQVFRASNPAREEVHARHILLDKEVDATNLIAHVQGGMDFAEAAKKYSTGPSASKGGDLGYFGRSDMVKPFADAAFALKTGAYTQKPVKTKFGWHVIKVEDHRTVQPPSFEALKPRLIQEVGQGVALEVMKKLVAAAKVERFAMDGSLLKAPSKAK